MWFIAKSEIANPNRSLPNHKSYVRNRKSEILTARLQLALQTEQALAFVNLRSIVIFSRCNDLVHSQIRNRQSKSEIANPNRSLPNHKSNVRNLHRSLCSLRDSPGPGVWERGTG